MIRRWQCSVVATLCCLLALATSASLGAGDPIPLDTSDPKYRTYLDKVRERIKAKWVYPRQVAERGTEGELLIEFHIAKDGRLEDIAVQRSSSVPLLDTSAMNAIKWAEPFPPVPEVLLSEGSLATSGQTTEARAKGITRSKGQSRSSRRRSHE